MDFHDYLILVLLEAQKEFDFEKEEKHTRASKQTQAAAERARKKQEKQDRQDRIDAIDDLEDRKKKGKRFSEGSGGEKRLRRVAKAHKKKGEWNKWLQQAWRSKHKDLDSITRSVVSVAHTQPSWRHDYAKEHEKEELSKLHSTKKSGRRAYSRGMGHHPIEDKPRSKRLSDLFKQGGKAQMDEVSPPVKNSPTQ